MPTTRQHPCRAAPPAPRRSRRSRSPSDKGSAAASRSTSTGACRAAGSTERTGCGRDRWRPPRDRAHAVGGQRPDRYRSSPRAPAGDRGGRRAGGRPRSSNRHACRESPRPRPRPPGPTGTRPIAQDFGELILDVSWLNQLDDVIFGHGISLLRWRSGGVKHPHDMPPSRFPPSPTFSDSSPPIDHTIIFKRHALIAR